MVRAAAKYVLTALLALLATQVAVPFEALQPASAMIWCDEAEQPIRSETGGIWLDMADPPFLIGHTSLSRREPDASVLFQRPPPVDSRLR